MRVRFAVLLHFAAASLACGATPATETSHSAGQQAAPAHAFRAVSVANTRTSVYIGTVSLTMPTFQRSGTSFESTYVTKVFPYFFYNENGRLQIELPDADLQRLAAGETIAFSGNAESSKGEPRRIEGRAVPQNPTEGKIKVRVFVTPKIELIFNTTYRFHD